MKDHPWNRRHFVATLAGGPAMLTPAVVARTPILSTTLLRWTDAAPGDAMSLQRSCVLRACGTTGRCAATGPVGA